MSRGRRLGLLATALFAALLCGPTLAAAKPGDILIADAGNPGSVLRLDPSTGTVTTVHAGAPFNDTFALDFEASGQLLVTDPGNPDEVFRVDPATGAVTTVTSGAPFGDILGITVGPNGHAFIADDTVAPNGAIFDVDPSTGAKSTLTDGSPFGDDPQGIDVNPAGQLFVADYGSGAIYRIDPSGAKTPVVTGATTIKEPELISLDASGKLIVPDGGNPPAVHRVDPATGVVTTLHADAPFVFPFGTDTTPSGDVIVADEHGGPGGSGAIFRITPSGSVTPIASGGLLKDPLDVAIEPPTCHGLPATIVGTTGPDTLTGSAFADVIAGLEGNDQIQAAGGNDTVCAGSGKDSVGGGSGRDKLFGEAGKDTLKGGKGKDKCVGGKGKDKGKSCEKGKL
jgi:Ca2+-binding RTX toxin-like protein